MIGLIAGCWVEMMASMGVGSRAVSLALGAAEKTAA